MDFRNEVVNRAIAVTCEIGAHAGLYLLSLRCNFVTAFCGVRSAPQRRLTAILDSAVNVASWPNSAGRRPAHTTGTDRPGTVLRYTSTLWQFSNSCGHSNVPSGDRPKTPGSELSPAAAHSTWGCPHLRRIVEIRERARSHLRWRRRINRGP